MIVTPEIQKHQILVFIAFRLSELQECAGSEYLKRLVEYAEWTVLEHMPIPFYGNKVRTAGPETPVKDWYCSCQCPDGLIEGPYPCLPVRYLSEVWHEHKDWQPRWSV